MKRKENEKASEKIVPKFGEKYDEEPKTAAIHRIKHRENWEE